MSEWISGIAEFIGAGGATVGFTWLGKEMWSNYNKRKFMEKQAMVEHDYYQKRLLFENKYEFYQDIYSKMKFYHGGLAAFEQSHLRRLIFSSQQDAIDKYKSYLLSNGANEVDLKAFEQNYYSDDLIKIAPNYDVTMQKIEDGRNEFNNYVSVNKFMLTKDEEEIITNFFTLGSKLEDFAINTEYIFRMKKDEQFEALINHFNSDYTKNLAEMMELIRLFEVNIKKALSL